MHCFFFFTPNPLSLIAKYNNVTTSTTFKIPYLSFNNLITHLVANIICFLTVIGIATSLTIPPDFNGNNKTCGVILLIAIKKETNGSKHSYCFK